MPGSFKPPDFDKGNPDTVGGYERVHGRPAAFEGSDGCSYTVAIDVDRTGDAGAPYGGYLLFVRWSRGSEPVVSGHLETGFLSHGESPEAARTGVAGLTLAEARAALNALIQRESGDQGRPWWEAMREEGTEEEGGVD